MVYKHLECCEVFSTSGKICRNSSLQASHCPSLCCKVSVKGTVQNLLIVH